MNVIALKEKRLGKKGDLCGSETETEWRIHYRGNTRTTIEETLLLKEDVFLIFFFPC